MAALLSPITCSIHPRDARESWPAASVAGHFNFFAQLAMELRKPRGVIAVSFRKMLEKWL